MKTYICTYRRHNPQLRTAPERTFEIEAKTITSARKKAEKRCENVSYGWNELVSVVQK